MANTKQKKIVSSVPARTPKKVTNSGIFDNLRKLPHPIEEITGQVIPPSRADLSPADYAMPKSASLAAEAPQATQIARLAEPASLAIPASLDPEILNLMATLPDIEGFTKLWHQMTDYLYRQLSLAEQAVHVQLFRLSWGYGKPTCHIGLPKLSERVGVSQRTVQDAIKGLVAKGLIRKQQVNFGKGKEQGIEYFVEPPPSMAKSASLVEFARLAKSASNKEALKEIYKKGVNASLDIKNCPDCHGTGFSYPNGHGDGVVRCKHEALRHTPKEDPVKT